MSRSRRTASPRTSRWAAAISAPCRAQFKVREGAAAWGAGMLGWVTKTLARRQHDEHLKSIHRVWHYIPEAPEYVSFCTLKFLSRLADANFEKAVEHLSKSDIVIEDGTWISRKPGLPAYQLEGGSELPDRMHRTVSERQDAKSKPSDRLEGPEQGSVEPDEHDGARSQYIRGEDDLPPFLRTRSFLFDLQADWRAHGHEVLACVREEEPGTYLRVVAALAAHQPKAR
jgi:hypothetical protein